MTSQTLIEASQLYNNVKKILIQRQVKIAALTLKALAMFKLRILLEIDVPFNEHRLLISETCLQSRIPDYPAVQEGNEST